MRQPRKGSARIQVPELVKLYLLAYDESEYAPYRRVPDELRRFWQVLGRIIAAENTRDALNSEFDQIRRKDAVFFDSMVSWLRTPHVTDAITRCGAVDVVEKLVESLREIQTGVPAHAAFRLNQPGRPRRTSLHDVYDEAAIAVYLQALIPAAVAKEWKKKHHEGPPYLFSGDRRELERTRKLVCSFIGYKWPARITEQARAELIAWAGHAATAFKVKLPEPYK